MKAKKWCVLLLGLWLWMGSTAYGAALSGEWKFYATDAVQDTSMDLIGVHAALRYDADEWQVFDAGNKPALAADTHYVWLTTRLPVVGQYRNPVLFFTTTEEAVRVYIDNELIYSYGEFGLYHHTYGTKWHLVVLPANYKGRQLSFQLYSDHAGRLGVVHSVSLDEGIYQIRRVFQHDILLWFALPLAVLLLIIMLLYYRVMRQHRRLYIYLAVFLALLAAWLLSAMQTSLLLWNNPPFWRYLMLLCGFAMPIFGNLMIYEVMASRPGWILAIAGSYAVFLLGVVSGELLGYNSVDQGISLFYIWLGISQFFVIVRLLYSAWQGDQNIRAMLVPVIGMPVLAGLDGLSAHFRLFSSPFYITPLAIVFLAFFVIWLLRANVREEQRLRDLAGELERKVAVVSEQAQIDALTKCFNRGRLQAAMKKEIDLAEYTAAPFTLLMFDIDLFKSVNDTYGHDAGDQVLIGFARTIRQSLDARHVFIRYGGEEFVVLCRGYNLTMAQELAEKIRARVAAAVLLEQRQITCSIGVSRWHCGQGDTAEHMLKRADLALYEAKHRGRNRIEAEMDGSV